MKLDLTWQIAFGIVAGFLILILILWLIVALGHFVFGDAVANCETTWYNNCGHKD